MIWVPERIKEINMKIKLIKKNSANYRSTPCPIFISTSRNMCPGNNGYEQKEATEKRIVAEPRRISNVEGI